MPHLDGPIAASASKYDQKAASQATIRAEYCDPVPPRPPLMARVDGLEQRVDMLGEQLEKLGAAISELREIVGH